MQTSVRGHRRAAALLVPILGLLLTIGPFGGIAAANHPTFACLDVEPETATNPSTAPDNEHTVTATMRTRALACDDPDQDAQNGAVKVSFEVVGPNDPQNDGDTAGTPDKSCLIPEGSASCTMSYTGTAAGSDTIRGWIDHDAMDSTTEADQTEEQDEEAEGGATAEPDVTDVVSKTWEAEAVTGTGLDCVPETDDDTDSGHSVTCSVRAGDFAVPSAIVDVEAAGANDPDDSESPATPDFTCTTNASGECTFIHGAGGTGPSSEVGPTTYRAWIDGDNNDGTSEVDAAEGRDEGAAPGSTPEPDGTDVVEKTWTPYPQRQISLHTSTIRVRKPGKKVTFFGEVTGHPACEAGQEVRLQSRKGKGRFKTIATVASEPSGAYSFRIGVMHTRTYRTLAPKTPICFRTRSISSKVEVK